MISDRGPGLDLLISWIRAVALGAALLSILNAEPALAGGLYLGEFATPSTGTANAGAGALGRDASTALHNPAAMTELEEHQVLLGLAPGFAEIEFDSDSDTPVAGNDGGDQGGFLPLVSGHYVHALNDRTRLGLSTFALSGAELNPNDDWVGRNQMTELELLTLAIFPSLGVKITDWLSVGGGPLVKYGKLDAKLRPPLPGPFASEANLELNDLTDWGVAGVASVLVKPTEDVKIGVLYQSESSLNLSGDVDASIGLNASVDFDLDFAQRVMVDGHWQATPDLGLLLTVGWEDWSTLKTTGVAVAGIGTIIELNLRDTWKLGGGVEYQISDDLLLQAGVMYDSSPLRKRNRTVALPLDHQIRVGVGTIWDWSDSVSVAFNFEWVGLGDAPVSNQFVKGEYDQNSLFFFGVSVNWKNLPWKNRGKVPNF